MSPKTPRIPATSPTTSATQHPPATAIVSCEQAPCSTSAGFHLSTAKSEFLDNVMSHENAEITKRPEWQCPRKKATNPKVTLLNPKIQFIKSFVAIQAILLAPSVLADNIGDRCNHNVEKEYTTCDNSRTNIIYCNAANSQWTFAYKCGQGCCYNAAPPGSGTGGSYAHCHC
ncbi:hypothetical protein PWT90_00280 [Aphanocladium album]|nr:hypothetical protein PWT90_00280 [Aphanocladium album]